MTEQIWQKFLWQLQHCRDWSVPKAFSQKLQRSLEGSRLLSAAFLPRKQEMTMKQSNFNITIFLVNTYILIFNIF